MFEGHKGRRMEWVRDSREGQGREIESCWRVVSQGVMRINFCLKTPSLASYKIEKRLCSSTEWMWPGVLSCLVITH